MSLFSKSSASLSTDFASLRASAVTPAQQARFDLLKAEFNLVHSYAAMLHRPSSALKACLWIEGVESIDQLSGDARNDAEGWAFVHVPQCRDRIDAKYFVRDQPTLLALGDLLREIRQAYAIVLGDEIARVEGEIRTGLAQFGCDNVEASTFMQKLRQEQAQHCPPVEEAGKREPNQLQDFVT